MNLKIDDTYLSFELYPKGYGATLKRCISCKQHLGNLLKHWNLKPTCAFQSGGKLNRLQKDV